MARNFPHFGWGKERESRETSLQFEERKKVALGWHIEPEDPIQQKLLFIAGELGRVSDKKIMDEVNILFKDKTLEERIALVERVNAIRNPGNVEQRGK